MIRFALLLFLRGDVCLMDVFCVFLLLCLAPFTLYTISMHICNAVGESHCVSMRVLCVLIVFRTFDTHLPKSIEYLQRNVVFCMDAILVLVWFVLAPLICSVCL